MKMEFKTAEIYGRWAKIIDKPVSEFDGQDKYDALFDYQEMLKGAFRSNEPEQVKRHLAKTDKGKSKRRRIRGHNQVT